MPTDEFLHILNPEALEPAAAATQTLTARRPSKDFKVTLG